MEQASAQNFRIETTQYEMARLSNDCQNSDRSPWHAFTINLCDALVRALEMMISCSYLVRGSR
jgi:hypothetical protein